MPLRISSDNLVHPQNVHYAPARLTHLSENTRSCLNSISDFFFSLLRRIWSAVQTLFGFGATKTVSTKDKPSKPIAPVTATPKESLKKFVGEVFINSNATGYVGRDRKYSFGKRIKLENGKPLQVSPRDYYFNVTIKEGTKVFETMLPSSLFSQCRVGNEVRFFYGNTFYQLSLAPFSMGERKKSFDDCQRHLIEGFRFFFSEFVYECDISENYFKWDERALVALSPQSKRIEIGKVGVAHLDFNSLHRISSDLTPLKLRDKYEFKKVPSRQIQALDLSGKPQVEKAVSCALPHLDLATPFVEKERNTRWHRFSFPTAGNPKIDMILDRNFFYVHISYDEEDIESKGFNSFNDLPLFEDRFYKNVFEDTKRLIDEQRIIAQRVAGVLDIDFPLVPKIFGLDEDEETTSQKTLFEEKVLAQLNTLSHSLN